MNYCQFRNETIKRMANGGEFSPFDLDAVWADIQNVCTANMQSIPEETMTAFTINKSSGDGHSTVLAPNGKLYLLPYASSTVKVIDTENDTISSFGNISGRGRYLGGCYAPNGYIYGVPYSATAIIKIDPATDTCTTFGTLSGSSKWKRCTVTPDGIIYAFPHSAGSILRIDTNDDTYDTITGDYLSGSNMYADCVLARNGCIYAIPRNSYYVLKLDTATDTYTSVGTISGNSKYLSGQIGLDGNIYALSSDGNVNSLKIDTANDTVSLLQITGDNVNGSCLAPNGYIYGVQYGGNRKTSKLDVYTPAFTLLNIGNTQSYDAIRVAPNGCLYAIPQSSSTVVKINLNCSKTFKLETLLSPYINCS